MAIWLKSAAYVVAVDTGFAHLAAALGVKTISIYGATNPQFTGALGPYSKHISAVFPCAPCLRRECRYESLTPPCYEQISPEKIWGMLKQLI